MFHTLDLEKKAFSRNGDVAGLFFWKKALKHNKEYLVSGYLKPDEVPGNGGVHRFRK